MFIYAPCVRGAVWGLGTLLPYSGVLLPTKTSWVFSHFLDSLPFIEFLYLFNGVALSLHIVAIFGGVWWCIILYIYSWFFFFFF
jgi:hypothetical protein